MMFTPINTDGTNKIPITSNGTIGNNSYGFLSMAYI